MKPLLSSPLGPVLSLAILGFAPGCDRAPEEEPASITAELPGDPPRAQRRIVEEMRFASRQVRSEADGGGRAWIETEDDLPPTVGVGQRGSWTILYEAGPLGIAEGGVVRLTVSAFWGWSPPQIEAPDAPGYTTVESLADGIVPKVTVPEWLDVEITGRALAAGERLRIVYGAGPARARADRYAESGSRFWISVDGDGDGIVGILPDSPAVTVTAGPPARLLLTLPSTAKPGERVLARLALLDRVGNAGVDFVGAVHLETVFEGITIPDTVRFVEADRGVQAVEIEVQEAGEYRVIGIAREEGEAEDAEPRIFALSNPLLVAAENPRILWGDLQGHSNLSDGTSTPEEYHRYARDVAGLDVVALTDHDHWGMLSFAEHPELWQGMKDTVDAFHDPGRFVAILGYEWTSWIHGHRHVLYFDNEGEVLSSFDEAYETPAQLWDALRGKRTMTFAHHSAGGPVATNWDYAPDPELEPVTEIVSVHGSSEAPDTPRLIYRYLEGNSVRDALDRGYRFGFLGSSDCHDGHPGAADLASGGAGTGVAAILAEELTRDAIYEALRERRCYATNGPRIILRTALGGARMGSTIPEPAEGEKTTLYLRVLTQAPLAYVDVIRPDGISRHELGEETWSFETAWELEGLKAGEYLYVRVVQVDQGTAWSSPFYIE